MEEGPDTDMLCAAIALVIIKERKESASDETSSNIIKLLVNYTSVSYFYWPRYFNIQNFDVLIVKHCIKLFVHCKVGDDSSGYGTQLDQDTGEGKSKPESQTEEVEKPECRFARRLAKLLGITEFMSKVILNI
jgi:hypothetical protein